MLSPQEDSWPKQDPTTGTVASTSYLQGGFKASEIPTLLCNASRRTQRTGPYGGGKADRFFKLNMLFGRKQERL